MDNELADELKKQIYSQMQEKETEELLKIWQENDREAWTNDAFEAAHQILLERLGNVPPQNAPPQDEKEKPIVETETYPHLDAVAHIASWVNGLAWIFFAFALLNVISICALAPAELKLQTVLPLIGSLLSPLVGGFFFIFLIAISHLIKVLLAIEENTRRSARITEKMIDFLDK